MKEQGFDVEIERDDDGFYIANVPALKGCHTQAESLDELAVRVREVVTLCLRAEIQKGLDSGETTPWDLDEFLKKAKARYNGS